MSETEEVTQAVAAEASAKKPTRRTRKVAAKAEAAAESAAEPVAEASEKARPKATKKTTSRAKKVKEESGEAAASAETTSTAEKPAAPVRRTRVKKAEAASAGDASASETVLSKVAASKHAAEEVAASEEAPAKKPVRRTRVKKAEAEESAEAKAEGAKASAADVAERNARASKAEKLEKSDNADKSEKPDKANKADKEDKADKSDNSDEASEDKSGKVKVDKQKNGRHNRQKRNNQQREVAPSVSKEELEELKIAELRAKADELEVDHAGMKKPELVEAVYNAVMKAEGFVEVVGILDILQDGYGFLRTQGYLPSETDCYVGTSLIRRSNLRKGDMVRGQTRPARANEKYAAIQKIISVNGVPVEELGRRTKFGDLTPVYPDECLVMEHGKNTITARVIDLVSPIGKGQRGLIVSPPKAGKTTILKDIAASISANNPEVHLMCLLVDERPEEVTDMQRSIKGEVISSTFDMPTENHIQVAELVIERAKRLVENGKDVVVLLDSLTRLARAYNLAQPASGRILSGGVDSTALYPPKKFLGAARNIEGGGSLTILASALVETGSKMDEVIFEEFKGTGNMELKLDRSLADRRIFPAIDPVASGTRKEDLLLNPQEAPLIWAVRRILANTNNTERAMDMLIKSLKQTDTNQEFLIRTAKKAQHSNGQNVTEF